MNEFCFFLMVIDFMFSHLVHLYANFETCVCHPWIQLSKLPHKDNGDSGTSNNKQWEKHDHIEKFQPLTTIHHP
jgi:hypothetical protein